MTALPPARRSLAALAALVLTATVLAAPASAAPDPAPDPLLKAMQRDLGLTPAQTRARWTAEQKAREAAHRLRPAVGAAGLYFDAGSGTLAVPVTDDAHARLVRASGATPVRVGHGPAALARVEARVSALVRAGADGVASWGTDPVTDRVVVRVTPRADAALRERLAALSPAVALRDVPVRYRQHGGDVVGGDYWKPGSEGNCSIGFSATGGDGSRQMLTAGHCTNDANQPAYGNDGSRLGTSNVGGNRSVNAREGDFGVVAVTETAWRQSAKVSGHGQGDITVTRSAEPTVGMSICRSGGTTGLRCGTVTQINQTIDYGNVVIAGLFVTNACSNGGDSGGAYVTGPASGATAVGLHSGGGNPCGQSGPNTIGQPVNEALTKWNLSLYTGTTAPGAPSIAPPGDQTARPGTPFRLDLRATGGTAPYAWTASGLPAGLSIDRATGSITGTPAAAGTSRVTATVTDAASRSATASFTLTVGTATTPPAVTDPGAQTAYASRPYRLAMTATGGTTPYTWTASGLPAGLSIDRATGVISGTPARWGLSTSTVTVTDRSSRTASVTFTWSVWNPWN
ncbi:putative Ig domain-containing protein [Actinomadura flavalba]|uniref:putative Ig domain-containing protein n=1 Tax=Actinomadura flavalba TaxID=1120938 RepID=UPI000369E843|nr:putative Ig domain-containing protein [Actinomadura flavalba]